MHAAQQQQQQGGHQSCVARASRRWHTHTHTRTLRPGWSRRSSSLLFVLHEDASVSKGNVFESFLLLFCEKPVTLGSCLCELAARSAFDVASGTASSIALAGKGKAVCTANVRENRTRGLREVYRQSIAYPSPGRTGVRWQKTDIQGSSTGRRATKAG